MTAGGHSPAPLSWEATPDPKAPHDSRRWVVSLAGVAVARTTRDIVRAMRAAGDEFESEPELLARIQELEPPSAYQRAMRLLSARERSVQELRERLTADGYSSATVRAVIEEFTESELVSDYRFAQMFCRTRRAKGWADARISRELSAAGVSDDVIQDVLGDRDPEQAERDALEIALAAAPRSDRDVARLVNRLARLGYSFETARRVAFMARAPRHDECS